MHPGTAAEFGHCPRWLVTFEIRIISGEKEALQAIRFGKNLAGDLLTPCFEVSVRPFMTFTRFRCTSGSFSVRAMSFRTAWAKVLNSRVG
jgi:hypothetical protein